MPPRKRRSLSQSSSDEDDLKRQRKYTSEIGDINENTVYFMKKPRDKRSRKSEVVLLDCKRIDQNIMLILYCSSTNLWSTLPMPAFHDGEDLSEVICAKNVIGFLHSSIIFWKDSQNLLSLNTSSYAIKTIPSMNLGKSEATSNWRYFCSLNKLIAVNIFTSEKLGKNYEKAVLNIMNYSFRDGGWEKLAEHHFEKRSNSIPYILNMENKEGLWISIADYYLNPNNYKVEKHKLHLLFLENQTWGLDEIECDEVSESYSNSRYFPSLSVDEHGNLCIITKPHIHRYDTCSSTWYTIKGMDPTANLKNVLADTISVSGLQRLYFQLGETCDFWAGDIESGECKELEPPPVDVFMKESSGVIQRNRHRVTNDMDSGKIAAFLVGDGVLQWMTGACFNQFECEF